VRELACIAVANLPRLTDPQIVGLVVERLSDPVLAVKVAAVHASITLAQWAGEEILGLGALQMGLGMIGEGLGEGEEAKESLVANALFFVGRIGNEQPRILEDLSKSQLPGQCLSAILSCKRTIAIPALEVLSLLAEDNKKLCQDIISHAASLLSIISALDSETKASLLSLMADVLFETNNEEQIFTHILPGLFEGISSDVHGEMLNHAAALSETSDFSKGEEKWISEAKAQATCLEVLTNLFAVENDELPKATRFLTAEIVKLIARAAKGPGKEKIIALVNYPEIVAASVDLQYAGFSCIQNLVINTESLSNNAAEVWHALLEQYEMALELADEETEFQENLFELLGVVTKSMCSISKKYPDSIVFII
jgi:hypothetical protein